MMVKFQCDYMSLRKSWCAYGKYRDKHISTTICGPENSAILHEPLLLFVRSESLVPTLT